MSPELLGQLGLAAGAAVASGLRLYATVAILGFLHRMGALTLPSGLEVLAQTPVIVLAASIYLVEFVADKVPIVDTVWDAVHTFIRVPAAAVLGFAALTDLQEPWRVMAALLCGTLALSAHGLKASTRVAVNTSPEPVSNWVASFAEDFAVFVILWLAIQHPVIAIAVALAVVIAAILAAALIVRALRGLFRRPPKGIRPNAELLAMRTIPMKPQAVIVLVSLLAAAMLGQQPPEPTKPSGMPENMEMYPLGFLKKGPKWTPEKTSETARIQEGHMAHLGAMHKAGKLVVAGPVGAGAGDLRGILVFKGITTEEAVTMASEDPAVKAGRLAVEVVPWWVEKGVLP